MLDLNVGVYFCRWELKSWRCRRFALWQQSTRAQGVVKAVGHSARWSYHAHARATGRDDFYTDYETLNLLYWYWNLVHFRITITWKRATNLVYLRSFLPLTEVIRITRILKSGALLKYNSVIFNSAKSDNSRRPLPDWVGISSSSIE